MPVTEFALLPIKTGYNKSEFISKLHECTRVQDQWVRENQPRLLQDKPYSSLSTCFLEDTNSPCLLITAPWDAPEDHHVWLQSEENKREFASLAGYAFEESESLIVFHMNPAGSEVQLRGDLFAQEGPFSVCKLSVNSSQKESVQGKYQSIEAQARVAKPGSRVWAGWRIERDADDDEELVIFWNQGALDGQLGDLLNTPDAEHEFHEFQHIE
ncbi:hypothetical protein B0J13DRAFT_442837 [Dactylonectria estremocensis]|uniref:Uncharacterized protein n=1 Tax=Dactylonectria estremocensis TaxID=1079267 RepID=A0A9P9ES28_9HYPO|nr:hypothetical protein B0J13DRAFT_442837 [Dactylonectria estremocensis]